MDAAELRQQADIFASATRMARDGSSTAALAVGLALCCLRDAYREAAVAAEEAERAARGQG